MIAAIDTVVRERMGIDPASLGPNVLARAVEGRMLARGLSDPALYTARLMTEQAERDALAADLAVSETWFFRGGKMLFERLAGFLADRLTARPGVSARALSVPCSTGEEPYSLAIAMHERFLTPNEYTLDAVDQSERVLARAVAARYSPFAFREGGTDSRPAYFRHTETDQWELLPHLRAAVRFLPDNLTSPLFLAKERAYDLIICRNLFIYLTPDARVRATANFDRLLALDGRLCLTPAEADRLPPGQFVPDGPTEFGIYRRAGTGGEPPRARADASSAPTPAPVKVTSLARSGPLKNAPRAAPAPPNTLEAARLLADAGQLDEARAACEALLRARATDADALALLGVVHLAAGRPGLALDALRKALYLAPDHAEALTHMMALCERRGDTARAAALRRRLDRLAREEGT